MILDSLQVTGLWRLQLCLFYPHCFSNFRACPGFKNLNEILANFPVGEEYKLSFPDVALLDLCILHNQTSMYSSNENTIYSLELVHGRYPVSSAYDYGRLDKIE